MPKQAKYEKLLQLFAKKSIITLEDCRKRHPEISSGTFYSIMNKLSKHYLVKKIPQVVGKRRIAYQKTNEYTIEKGRRILTIHSEETKNYQKKTVMPETPQKTEESMASKSISNRKQEMMHEAKRRIHNLVEDYMRVLASGERRSFNEERVRIAFVIPLLEALGWKFLGEVEAERAGLNDSTNFVVGTGRETKILVEVESLNRSLDEYRVTRDGPKSYAALAIQHAWDMEAGWVLLTNFEETRFYSSKVRKSEDGLVWKMRFTEYESRFDELAIVSRESVLSGALTDYEMKIERPLEDDQITALLKKEGPLTRRQILEKSSLSRSYRFPWYIQKFGSRRRKVYYIEGQEDLAREVYEKMVKPKPKPPSWSYPKEYFLNLLNLKRTTYYSPAPDGTPTWWERRANRQYTCAVCRRIIKKGEKYIGRKKLKPGMRGPYGYRGTYITDYYHIVCLLKGAQTEIEEKIGDAHSEISRLKNEITDFEGDTRLKREQIENCKTLILKAKEDYESASSWRKFGKWFSHHYTSWSKNREISRLVKEITHIENMEIPERETRITDLRGRISNLESRLSEVETRIQELMRINVYR